VRQQFELCKHAKRKPLNSFRGQNPPKLLVSSLEYLPHSIFQKTIVSAETIRGNTVFGFDLVLKVKYSTILIFEDIFLYKKSAKSLKKKNSLKINSHY
jgi:hypothetical protein